MSARARSTSTSMPHSGRSTPSTATGAPPLTSCLKGVTPCDLRGKVAHGRALRPLLVCGRDAIRHEARQS